MRLFSGYKDTAETVEMRGGQFGGEEGAKAQRKKEKELTTIPVPTGRED